MRFLFPLCVGFLLAMALYAPPAVAQNDPPPEAPPAAVADTGQKDGDNELKVPELGGKYATWVHHVGTADESVVAVRITATDEHGDVVTRTGSGLVLRCDGFLLIPDMLAPPNDRGFDAQISISRMDGEEITAPLNSVGRPQFRYHRTPYVALKVNDHHIPCLPLLNPVNVQPNAAVRVTWAVPDTDKPGHIKTFSRKGVIGERLGKENRYSLKLTGGAGANAPEPILGAVVTDEKGIAGLGMVSDAPAGAGSDLTFSTFARLDYICDEVGLRPSLADVALNDNGRKTVDGMAYVSGGPVRVPRGPMGQYYARYYRTDVVCTPPFLMDILPVTIGDYRNFLRRLKAARLPQAWEKDFPTELERDIRRGDLPITGAAYEDALRYAEAQGKRLPTSVEWLKAAQGAKLNWVAQYKAQAEIYYRAILDIYQRKVDHWADVLARLTQGKGSSKPTKVYVDTATMRDLNRQQYIEQVKFFHTYTWPLEVNAPVGARELDVSAFGVRDVVANAPEMTIKNYARGDSGLAPKLLPADADIYLTSVLYQYISSVTDNESPVPIMEGNESAFQIDKDDPTQIDYAFGLIALSSNHYVIDAHGYFTSAQSLSLGAHIVTGNFAFHMEIHPHNYAGFRMAR